jgi:hypothetical protein
MNINAEFFEKKYPAIFNEIKKMGYDAGRQAGYARGYDIGLDAGRATRAGKKK